MKVFELIQAVLWLIWVLLSHNVSFSIVDPVLDWGIGIAKRRLGSQFWTLSPEERVNHLLCDSEVRRRDDIQRNIAFVLMLSPLTYFLWGARSEAPEHPIALWVLRFILPLFVTWTGIQIIRVILRIVHRESLFELLREERRHWDPANTNSRVFVVRRDSCATVKLLFHDLTRVCYSRGITLLQYMDFAWPQYALRENFPAPSGNIYYWAYPHPEAVADADVVLWLDISETSENMEMELHFAERSRVPIVRVTSSDKKKKEFIISSEMDGSRLMSDWSELPGAIVDVLQRVLGRPQETAHSGITPNQQCAGGS